MSGVDRNAPVTQGDSNSPLAADPVMEAYKKDVDRTLLRENLKLTVERRILNLQSFVDFVYELRKASKIARQ